MKATPASGFKIPKVKESEQVIGRRVYGDTNIFSKPKNFNYELRRANEEKNRFRFIKWCIILSFAPVGWFLLNAENNFKKAAVKEISSKRRERLDKEYGVDRDAMTDDFAKLDEMYRISEKKEIEKFARIGKSASQYYEQKEMT